MAEDLSPAVQQEIIEQFPDNHDVFEQVYQYYFDQIYKFLVKKTMSSDLAYDIAGDTFLKAFNTFHKFKWSGISMKSWLYRIAVNALNDHYRGKTLFVPTEDIVNNPQLLTDCREELEEMDRALFGDDQIKALNEAMAQLNPKYRETLHLYYFSNLSQREIADTLGRSEGAVKAMIHRAMTELRNRLSYVE